jgi:predicted ABC-type ATPase
MDIFRTVAHELVHHKQNEDGRLGHNVAEEGATGSDIENEANAVAGKIMRWYGKAFPQSFQTSYVTEQKAIILGGTPGSGKDKVLKEAILPIGFKEVSQDTFSESDMTGENLVINGTMSNYTQTKAIKDLLESNGYQTMMVFVNTTNEVSKQRNEERGARGGRVISEVTRFSKWKDAQDLLERYQKLFEVHAITNNNLDLNSQEQRVILEWKGKMHHLTKAIRKFALSEADYKFETMLGEHAGEWGTPELTRNYQRMTPGQPLGFRAMKVLKMKKNMKNEESDDLTKPNDPIARWLVKEETRNIFRKKYGALAEQKMQETARRLESYDETPIAMVSATTGNDEVRPDPNAEFEKQSIYKYNKKQRKFKTKGTK